MAQGIKDMAMQGKINLQAARKRLEPEFVVTHLQARR